MPYKHTFASTVFVAEELRLISTDIEDSVVNNP
jgi:hypothetical protein